MEMIATGKQMVSQSLVGYVKHFELYLFCYVIYCSVCLNHMYVFSRNNLAQWHHFVCV